LQFALGNEVPLDDDIYIYIQYFLDSL